MSRSRKYFLSPEAEAIVDRRAGVPSSVGVPLSPSKSSVLNSIVLRYEEMIVESEKKLLTKYNEDELHAIHEWISRQDNAHESIVKIDSFKHASAFEELAKKGCSLCGDSVLDSRKRAILLRIISSTLRLHELFCISDVIARKLSAKGRLS